MSTPIQSLDTQAPEKVLEIVTILDRSGSMATIRHDMEGGFNEFVKKQAALVVPGQRALLTLVEFSTGPTETKHEAVPLHLVPSLSIIPGGGTALLDAVGNTLTRLEKRETQPDQYLVVIITDGEENSSQRWDRLAIQGLVKRLGDKGWQFVYLGANVDAFAEAGSMAIGGAVAATFTPSGTGIRNAFMAVASNTVAYRSNNLSGQSLTYTTDQRSAMLDDGQGDGTSGRVVVHGPGCVPGSGCVNDASTGCHWAPVTQRARPSPKQVASLIAVGKIAREDACDGKARFNTAAKAVRSATKWREREGTDLAPYACPFCGGFHLTSVGG